MLKDFASLKTERQKDWAVLLGSGTSINRLTLFQWSKLFYYHDVWALNNWVYHPFAVPDFYHVEVKRYNYRLIQRRLIEKQNRYKGTKFIFQHGKRIGVNGEKVPLHKVTFAGALKYEYEVFMRDPKRQMKRFNAHYRIRPGIPTKSYDMSLTTVLDMMYQCGYEKVVLAGVDMHNSYYFWTGGDPIYGEVHHQTNKAHEAKDPNLPHATSRARDFLIDFDRRHMRPQGRRIVLAHPNPFLQCKGKGLEYESLD